MICDRDPVIATAGVPRKEYADKSLSEELENVIEGRGLYLWRQGDEKYPVISQESAHFVSCAMPIISEGDIVGCVVSVADRAQEHPGQMHSDVECKLVQTAASFLGRQLEG